MITRTKAKAVKVAHEQVGQLFEVGGGYSYHLWKDEINAWYEMPIMQRDMAMEKRSQHLINVARNYLRLDETEYKGGYWEKYL